MINWILFIIGILLFTVGLAKHKKRRSNPLVVLNFADEFVIGALANNAVASEPVLQANFDHDFYAISADIQATITGLTAGEGDPMTMGWFHGDYSNAEVAEALNVTLLGPANKIEQERQRRLVRRTGVFQGQEGTDVATEMVLRGGQAGGPSIRTKLRFVIQEDKALKIYAMNRSDATLTTGATIHFSGQIYGRWV